MSAVKYLVFFSLALAIAGVLAWDSYIGRECGGPLPGLGYGLTGAVVVVIGAALCGTGAVMFLSPRTRPEATVLVVFGAGLFAGWWIGSELARPNDPCPKEPEPTSREGIATLRVRLQAPYELVLTGTGSCYLSLTEGRAVDAIDGFANSDDGWEITLTGLPVEDPHGRPYDSFDVDLFDGERAWGYRPTSWAQVEVERVDDLSGTTRFVGLPLLAGPEGSSPVDALEGRIDWQCDRPDAHRSLVTASRSDNRGASR